MFKTVSPVCPVLDMKEHITFWQKLGFKVVFASQVPPETADYAGVGRDNIEFHLQAFTKEQLNYTQVMAIRIQMIGQEALEKLYADWNSQISITAPLEDKPWGTREFGFYDPSGGAFFFYTDR